MLKFINESERGVTISVIVTPRSSSNSIVGVVDGRLKIKLTSPPIDGKANENLIKFLSKLLNVSKSSIEILKGETSKKKTLLIRGISKQELTSLLLSKY